MGQSSAAPSSEFINGADAKRLYGVPACSLTRAAVVGQLEVKLIPGRAPLYRTADCMRLGAELREERERRGKLKKSKKAG